MFALSAMENNKVESGLKRVERRYLLKLSWPRSLITTSLRTVLKKASYPMTWGKDISSTGKNEGYLQESAWTFKKHQWINVGMQIELERHWKRKQLTQ